MGGSRVSGYGQSLFFKAVLPLRQRLPDLLDEAASGHASAGGKWVCECQTAQLTEARVAPPWERSHSDLAR